MNSLRNKIPVIFNGGSYGSFLIYSLISISKKDDKLETPFTETGSSHKLITNSLVHDENRNFNFEKNNNELFVKYHPKTYKKDSLIQNIIDVTSLSKKSIFIYPTSNNKQLVINNIFHKIWKDDWLTNELKHDSYEKEIFLNNLYSNWNIKNGTPISDIPRWIQREFLSYYYYTAWDDLYEWNFLDTYNSIDNVFIVTLDELLYNFKDTLLNLCDYCEIEPLNLENVLELHSKMVSLQTHYNKDVACNNYVESFLNNTRYEFLEEFSLIDEAYIQKTLRDQGIEIKCHDLNTFPTSTTELKKITFKTK